jgi:hypothetical protein
MVTWVARAGYATGKHVQAFPFFGAERRGVEKSYWQLSFVSACTGRPGPPPLIRGRQKTGDGRSLTFLTGHRRHDG